jgi:hypothetical protein
MQLPEVPYEIPRFEIKSLDAAREIFDALGARDDKWILEAARRAESQEMFFEQLRGQVGFTTYSGVVKDFAKHKMEYHCALIMVPVILQSSQCDLIGNEAALSPVIMNVRRWLQEWFENKVEISLYSAPLGYDEICQWTPSIMREKLEQLASKSEPTIEVPPRFDFHLPDEAPGLAFFTAAVHRPLVWPTLPPEDTEGDLALQARLAGSLEVCASGAVPSRVTVLPPQFASEAIASGLAAWVTAIHQKFGLKRWDVQQCDQDQAVLQLEVGEGAVHTSPIPVRTHQLGLDGIETILAHVAQMGSGYLVTRH